MSKCPVFSIAGLVGKKWTIAVLQQVGLHGGAGFNAISRRMRKISPKMLSARLAALEKQGLITRQAMHANGVERSSYALTAKGRDLEEVILALKHWNAKYHLVDADCAARDCTECPFY